MDLTQWTEYTCKSGQTLLIKVAGEHEQPSASQNGSASSPPTQNKNHCSVVSQTDDNGCSKGCTCVFGENSVQDCRAADNQVSDTYTNDLASVLRVLEESDSSSDDGEATNSTTDTGNTKHLTSKGPLHENDGSPYSTEDVNIDVVGCDESSAHELNKYKQCSVDDNRTEGEMSETMVQLGTEHLQTSEHGNTGNVPTVEKHTKIEEFRCPYPSCYKSFSSKRQYIAHRQTHARHKCPFCDKTFPYNFYITKHLPMHTGKTNCCPFCQKEFSCKSKLTRHLPKHTDKKPHKCSDCDKAFSNKNDLIQHMMIAVDDNGTGGTVKDITYNTEDIISYDESSACELNKHNQCSVDDNRTEGEMRDTKVLGTEHLQTNAHGSAGNLPSVEKHTKTEEFRCSYAECTKSFSSKSQYTEHCQTHARHKCPYCDKTFPYKFYLTAHLETHTGEKPLNVLACFFCQNRYLSKKSLTSHLQTHTGEKPHKCSECDKAFSCKSGLIQHLRSHTGGRPFICSFCKKTFTRQGDLTKHLRDHTGEKNHKCSYCGESFLRKHHLNLHIQIHNVQNPHTCTVCGRSFQQKHNLIKHLQREHIKENL